MRKIAVVIYGPPGAGKGTQANIVAKYFHLLHFDTGSFLERYLHDPENQNNKVVVRERKIFDSGVLNTPTWVLKLVKDMTKKINKAGFGVVYSGSPRTEFEAFGEGRTEGLIKTLSRLYGQENIFVFSLKIPWQESLKRNKARLISPLLGLPIMGTMHNIKTSPFTGEPLVTRKALDDPEVIKTRLKEYEERTKPIEKGLRERGYKVFEIDGTPLPYKVFEKIKKKIK